MFKFLANFDRSAGPWAGIQPLSQSSPCAAKGADVHLHHAPPISPAAPPGETLSLTAPGDILNLPLTKLTSRNLQAHPDQH